MMLVLFTEEWLFRFHLVNFTFQLCGQIFYFYFFIYSYFIYYIPNTVPHHCSFSVPPHPFPLSQTLSSSVYLLKRSGLPELFAKHSTISYNQTRHKPSYQGQKRQKEKGPKIEQKCQRHPLLALLGVPQEHPGHNHNIYTKDLPQTQSGSMIFTSFSVSFYEPCIVDFIGRVLTVSLAPMVSTIPNSLYRLL